MAPIKVGFIGLTSNVDGRPLDGTRWANNAHLKYLQENGGKYKIVALLNSSKENAERAAAENDLGDVATYGDPEELAADPNIDLVVVSVRVDRHYPVVKPSILAGKDVIVEWPLGANLDEAQELLTIAKEKKVKNAVVLQAVFSPVVGKVKELVALGQIGKVLSSTVGLVCGIGGPNLSQAVHYFTDRNVGGNMMTIHFGHTIEPVLHVLGEFKTFNSLIATQRGAVNIIDNEGNVVEKGKRKDTPDQILVQGTTTSGAVLSYHLRECKTFPGTPCLDWRIFGDKGEIRVTSETPFLNVGAHDTKIEITDAAAEASTVVEIRKDQWEGLAQPGRNIARLYEAFAADKKGSSGVWGYMDFEHAVLRHKLIDEIFKTYDMQQQ